MSALHDCFFFFFFIQQKFSLTPFSYCFCINFWMPPVHGSFPNDFNCWYLYFYNFRFFVIFSVPYNIFKICFCILCTLRKWLKDFHVPSYCKKVIKFRANIAYLIFSQEKIIFLILKLLFDDLYCFRLKLWICKHYFLCKCNKIIFWCNCNCYCNCSCYFVIIF